MKQRLSNLLLNLYKTSSATVLLVSDILSIFLPGVILVLKSMSSRVSLGIKRKRPSSDSKELTPDERKHYDLIKSKGDMGIWKGDIKRELNIANAKIIDNCVKSLLAKQLIKEVANVQAKAKKRLMAIEFEPSKELTGGVWYNQEGSIDDIMIESLKKVFKRVIEKQKFATADGLRHKIRELGVVNFELNAEHVKEILGCLVLENEIVRVKSTGTGEFASFPMNTECYKLKSQIQKSGTFTMIPCGVCPRISQCSPDGIISPITCEYYNKWLDF